MSTNVNVRGNSISVGNGLAAYAEIPIGDKLVLIEMGTLIDIQTQSSRQIGAVHKNGLSAAQDFQRGIRNSQGRAIWATIGKKPIIEIYEKIAKTPEAENLFKETDLKVESLTGSDGEVQAAVLGPGMTEGVLESAMKEGKIEGETEISISLQNLPPINLIIIARADVVRQTSLAEGQKGDYTPALRYNTVVEKKFKGIKFTSASSGIDGKEGFQDVSSNFILLGKEEPWKSIGTE